MSGAYAYNEITFMANPSSIEVYDVDSDSMFTLDFGGEVKGFCIGEEKIAYILESDRKLCLCDLRGENKEVIIDRPDASMIIRRFLGDYLVCNIPGTSGVMPGGDYVLNLKTGEFTAIPTLSYP